MTRYVVATCSKAKTFIVFDLVDELVVSGAYANKYSAQTECDRLNDLEDV